MCAFDLCELPQIVFFGLTSACLGFARPGHRSPTPVRFVELEPRLLRMDSDRRFPRESSPVPSNLNTSASSAADRSFDSETSGESCPRTPPPAAVRLPPSPVLRFGQVCVHFLANYSNWSLYFYS